MPVNKYWQRKIISIILIAFTILSIISCKECPTEPIKYPPTELSIDYRGANFTWLRLSMADSGSVQSYKIKRNNLDLLSGYFHGADTLIIDDTVMPDSTYIYKAYRIRYSKAVDSSEAVTVMTLDTTSHDFQWEIDTLGDYGSCLFDVFAFSENEIWVVGEIKFNDKPGYPHGAAVWNGTDWDIKLLTVGTSRIRPRGIWASSNTDIWFACGSIYHWNGNETTAKWLRNINTDETVEKVWGSSSNDIYFVGNEGLIIHYDGTNFTRMNSGTDAELRDIHGIVDPLTRQVRIWVTGIMILLYYDGNDWQVVWDKDHPYFEDNFNNPNTVYAPDDRVFTVSVWGGGNSGVYLFNQFYPKENHLLFSHDLYVRSVDGNDINDLFIVGDYFKVYHYNGNTVYFYPQLEIGGSAYGISENGNYAVIVGSTSSSYRAIVFRGVR